MIQLFTAEYMMHPVGLEMSQNTCGHNCFYCFATLKDANRKFDSKKFANQMNKLQNSDTFLSRKIKQNYPIVFSNNTDPFAKNNENITREILPTLIHKKIPLFIQTKTGENMFEIIEDLPPSTFYISITGINDKISREVERQAPLVSERIDAIDKLKKLGHHVIVAINPLAEEWIPENDFEKLIEILKSKEIKSIPLGMLYFKEKELHKIEKFKKGGVTPTDYLKKDNKALKYLKKMVVRYKGNGVLAPNMPFYSTGIQFFLHKDQKKIKTIFDFNNHIIDTYKENETEIKFEEFFNFFNQCDFLENGYKMDNYIFSIAPKLWIGKKENQNILSKEHFYNIIWNANGISQSLSMQRLYYKNKENNYIYKGGSTVDSQGNIYNVLNKQ